MTRPRQDDGAIVRAVLAGSPDAYGALVDRHAAAVFRIVRSAVRQQADAEDVAQEVFLAAFRSLDRLREPDRFRTWLLGIAARKAADCIRRRKRRAAFLPLDGDVPAPAPAPPPPAPADAIEAVVEGLPDGWRLVFALRHHEGYSCVRIARLLEIPEGTVYSRLSRVHAAIRKALEVRG